jgi:hypothetical protein
MLRRLFRKSKQKDTNFKSIVANKIKSNRSNSKNEDYRGLLQGNNQDNNPDTAALNALMLIYTSWYNKEKNELSSRKVFSWIYQIILVLQLIALNVLVFLIGFGIIHLSNELFYSFSALVVVELIGIIYIMVNYIFSERKTTVLEEAYKLIDLILLNKNMLKEEENDLVTKKISEDNEKVEDGNHFNEKRNKDNKIKESEN